jgi:RNA polymerase sigma factor (sigma-70 family)
MSEAERAREQQLILDNMGLVVSLARSFSPRNQQELEEYIQSGRIGLWRAVKNYNSSKGALSTLAWNYIRWEIIRNLPNSKRNKNKIKLTMFSDIVEDDYPIGESREHLILKNVEEMMPASLTKEERTLITMRGQGYTMAEVGSYFGKSRAWAHTVFKKASTKIREANNCNE